jgi:hypothetical protein
MAPPLITPVQLLLLMAASLTVVVGRLEQRGPAPAGSKRPQPCPLQLLLPYILLIQTLTCTGAAPNVALYSNPSVVASDNQLAILQAQVQRVPGARVSPLSSQPMLVGSGGRPSLMNYSAYIIAATDK